MVQFCTKCARANPEDACYCYFDGFVLGNGSRNGGPLAIGAQVFAQAFVFPTGRACRSFDELAIACQEEWKSARELLNQGYLEAFFGGIGRIDLVMAAKEASKFPDQDRGLDQLLGKLPSEVLAAPRLSVETKEVNLGVLKIGDSREFELHLENQGMRLVYGSVSCGDSKNVWLTLGDQPGTTEKHFQFGSEYKVKVKVCGDRLRANAKPQETKLVIDTNGGRAAVTVRCEVPVKAFPSGVLAGARSPRDLASKAKANTKEAAPCFERGEIEEWYKANGWSYPVTGPVASGLHAIQQFFEALGLVKPPVVVINTREISWSGSPGDRLACEIKVESQEKKPVYAHAVSDVPWLQPEKAKLNGRVATISVVVPAVPDKPGRTLTGRLTVQSNGSQRFDVPVTLAVQGNPLAFDEPEPEPEPEVLSVVPVEEPLAVEVVGRASQPDGRAGKPDLPAAVAAPTAPPPLPPAPVTPSLPPPPPQTLESMFADEPSAGPGTRSSRKRKGQEVPIWMHATPAILLAVAVLCAVIFDLAKSQPTKDGPINELDSGTGIELLNLQFHTTRHGSFGLEMKKEKDANDQPKRLTFDSHGGGDNIIVKLDELEFFFGQHDPRNRPNKSRNLPKGKINTKTFTESDVVVEQRVELVRGPTGNYDTCLVLFTINNNAKVAHEVGLRAMMDTYIGANDGVPFTIPGHKGFLDTMKEFSEKEIPDYIEVIEKPDTPDDLGTIVRMGLKLPGLDLEPIQQMRICLYPGSQTKWIWDMEPMNKNPMRKDSCVALYWNVVKMNPGDKRTMGYTYGLSELSINVGESPIALSAPASVKPDEEFVLTAYIWNAKPGQKIKLELPEGLELGKDEVEEKRVDEAGNRVQVSWRVKAGKAGDYSVSAKMGSNISRALKIVVRTGSFLG